MTATLGPRESSYGAWDPAYGHAFLHLPFPSAHLNGKHSLILSNLVDRLDTLDGFQGNTRLELRTVCPSFSFHGLGGILTPLNLPCHS